MAAITICSDFGAQKIKSDTVSTVSPSICHEVMGPDAMIFIFKSKQLLGFKAQGYKIYIYDCVDHNKLGKILKEMGIPDHLICLLRNLYAGQEATVRIGHGTTDWFQIGKGLHQGCILLP